MNMTTKDSLDALVAQVKRDAGTSAMIWSSPHVWMAGAISTLGEWADAVAGGEDDEAFTKALELIAGMTVWVEAHEPKETQQ